MAKKKLPPGVKLVRTLQGHTDSIERIAWSPDGRMLASPSNDGTIRMWNAETGECLHTLEEHKGTVTTSVAFHADGRTLASGSSNGTIELWDAASGRLLRTLKGHADSVSSVAFDPRGCTLASGSDDYTVKLWEPASGRLLRTLEGLQVFVLSVAFDPVGSTLAVGRMGSNLELREVATGKLLHTLDGHQNNVYTVAFDPVRGMLASGSDDKTVKLWDAARGRLLRTLEGHTEGLSCAAFSPTGRLLATNGDDTVRLWVPDTGVCAATIPEPAPGGNLPGLSFHPYLPLLAAVGSDRKGQPARLIHIWELELAVLLRQPVGPTVTYTSAKVVLVGESNVGKSYLAHRIAKGSPPEDGMIRSTHGMTFWPLEPERLSPAAKVPQNQRRDVVLWDMGGQEEYRLIHQLFLHDTTVALVLLDPTRGATAFKEVEAWNKYLDKQLRGRAAVKLLVGAKLDEPSDTIDRQGLDRLVKDCGFARYHETSAIKGRGIADFCEGVAKAIDWDGLGKTSRPELFQRIRDEIEARRKRGEVVLHLTDLYASMTPGEVAEMVEAIVELLVSRGQAIRSKKDSGQPSIVIQTSESVAETDFPDGTRVARPEMFQSIYDEIDARRLKGESEIELDGLHNAALKKDVNAVTDQLATQGVIARSRVSTGEPVLVLQVQEIERYAGSLIVAARNNPRGVPALELRAIAQTDFSLPGIADKERLPRSQEKAVLECTVQLMLEHGICFQHEGLLIFPTLFATAPTVADTLLPHAVSLYYDFAGAIDNIYASLIAWLVLARDFGRVRLWTDRAEFEVKDGGLCGLRKVGRPGGFAHVDVYFDTATPTGQQELFVSFVEEHLRQHGVEIKEHMALTCACGHKFEEETLRQRIARGEKDVLCPLCETRHNLAEGAAESRQRNPAIAKQTWTLKTAIEKRRQKSTEGVLEVIEKSEAKSATGPIRLLHLSDLHFTADTPVRARLQWLLDDLKQDSGLGFKELDYLVISGDFTDKGGTEGFEKAYEFVSGLTRDFALSAERCIFVPGNHDVVDRLDAYARRKDASGLKPGEWFQEGPLVMARDPGKYSLRFKPFSDGFYHKFLQQPYPADYAQQGTAIPFWETGLQFLTLNSCWQIDEFNRKRAGLLPEAVANAIDQAQKQEEDARKTGNLPKGKPLLRIAVWHHAVAGPEQMKDVDFLGNLQKNGVRIALHGDVHQMQRDLIGYWHEEKKVHVVGSGSFGARAEHRPEATPRLYNVLEIARDLKSVRVHTREQRKPDGAWDGWHEWPHLDGGNKGRMPYYDIKW